MSIKLLAMCRRNETGFFTLVSPFLIPNENPLANVNGVFNAINIHSNMLGDVMFYGKGAGKNATASAVVADVIDIVKHRGKHIDVNMKAESATVTSKDNIVRQFFVRVPAELKEQAADIFGKDIEEVAAQVIKETRGVPFIMPFNFGEYGYDEHSSNICGGLMLSFNVFGKD